MVPAFFCRQLLPFQVSISSGVGDVNDTTEARDGVPFTVIVSCNNKGCGGLESASTDEYR